MGAIRDDNNREPRQTHLWPYLAPFNSGYITYFFSKVRVTFHQMVLHMTRTLSFKEQKKSQTNNRVNKIILESQVKATIVKGG